MTITAGLTGTDIENAEAVPARQHTPTSRIAGVGTAVAGEPYSQRDLLEIFRITDSRVWSVFLNSAIERRYLSLLPADDDGVTTGFEMGIAPQCSRIDVVGMGCNAGLNALGVTAAWSAAHPAGSRSCCARRRVPPRICPTRLCGPRS